jgi:hypothetical protein
MARAPEEHRRNGEFDWNEFVIFITFWLTVAFILIAAGARLWAWASSGFSL